MAASPYCWLPARCRAAVARFAGLPLALVTCAALLTITILLIQRLARLGQPTGHAQP